MVVTLPFKIERWRHIDDGERKRRWGERDGEREGVEKERMDRVERERRWRRNEREMVREEDG